jgi:hypothetical protein
MLGFFSIQALPQWFCLRLKLDTSLIDKAEQRLELSVVAKFPRIL